MKRKLFCFLSVFSVLAVSFSWSESSVAAASSEGGAQPGVTAPVVSCDTLASVDLSTATGAFVHDLKAGSLDTPKGSFCKVTGQIAPSVNFEVDLPVHHWTQRFLMGGCGGLCGLTRVGVSNAGTCAPALNGEFVMAGNDMGHTDSSSGPLQGDFGKTPQKRIDFAYRANHLTTLAAKALIKAFYGQGPRFSYFVGCSDGGREALVEAQRFPDDFDGISAGAPVGLFTVQNSFYHAWNIRANQRPDGTNILLRGRLPLLHSAVISHCDTLSGVKDGILEDPRACRFDPSWVQCSEGEKDISACLTPEETQAAVRLYKGAADKTGRLYSIGGPLPGSELQWSLPETETGQSFDYGIVVSAVSYLLPLKAYDQDISLSKFKFDKEFFDQMTALSALYNSENTNLQSFQKHGGRLLLWHGLADQSVSPLSTIAYYQGLQKQMGQTQTESFVRFYLLPGVGHCGGGDGFSQVDFLSPLMAWTETGQPPSGLIAGQPVKKAQAADAPAHPGMEEPARTEKGKKTVILNSQPYALPDEKTSATRPVFPYPYIARYTGNGDEHDARNYQSVLSPVTVPMSFSSYSEALIGPDNQSDYVVEKGLLTKQK